MSKCKAKAPKIAAAALMTKVQAAQEKFEALYKEVEANLERSRGFLEREDKLIGLATTLAESGPNLVLPPGPLPEFAAQSVIEIAKLTYRSAMTDIPHALVKGDFSGLEAESVERVVHFMPDLDNLMAGADLPEC